MRRTLAIALLSAASLAVSVQVAPAVDMLKVVPRPLSYWKGQKLTAQPGGWQAFLAQQPARPADHPVPTRNRVRGTSGGIWQAVTSGPANVYFCNPELLHDGTVVAQDCDAPDWWRLTPDINGDYADGTWSEIATMPVINDVQYSPLYHASAVLPDGRLIVEGGEYNGSQNNGNGVWTNLGAIYDPVANTWTPVNPPNSPADNPTAWSAIGDAQSIVLPNGVFMLAACCAYPDANALFDPGTLTWRSAFAPNAGSNYQDEQGYTLMQNGNVLTLDIWTNYFIGGNANNAEQYRFGGSGWGAAGSTPVSLVDPIACGNFEIGPAVTRGDGSVVAFGGNTGCVAGQEADPTAIYSLTTGTWSKGPNIPHSCRLEGVSYPCDLADAPAALLPDGNILFAASPGYGGNPTHFFEFTPANTINQVSDTLYFAHQAGAYWYNFLVLPSGQVLETDFSGTPEVYTPAGAPVAAWAPTIIDSPGSVEPGSTYDIIGTQLNGVSQGAAYGDDYQSATNYPIVRITNNATGHVFYAVTGHIKTMSIAPGTKSLVKFTVPSGIEAGPSQIVVVANGNPSAPARILVE